MTAQNNRSNLTLEEIRLQKKQVLQQVRIQKAMIQDTAEQLFTPVKSYGKFDSLIHSVNSGLAMYDGVMTGIRLMRRVRTWFKR